MSTARLSAAVEAAFAIEMQTSPAIRALIELYGREQVRLIWILGFVAGEKAGLDRAVEIYARTA
jgi:hypothetical protein